MSVFHPAIAWRLLRVDASQPLNWRQARRRTLLLWVAAGAALCLLIAALAHVAAYRSLQAAHASQVTAEQRLLETQSLATRSQPAGKLIRKPLDLPALLAELRRSSEESGVTVQELSATPLPAAAESGSAGAELNLALQGRYAGIKDVLRQALDRYPAMRLARLELAQPVQDAPLAAKAMLMWYTPLPSAPSAPAR